MVLDRSGYGMMSGIFLRMRQPRESTHPAGTNIASLRNKPDTAAAISGPIIILPKRFEPVNNLTWTYTEAWPCLPWGFLRGRAHWKTVARLMCRISAMSLLEKLMRMIIGLL